MSEKYKAGSWIDGWQAYCANRTRRSNPHKRNTRSDPSYKAWINGFNLAEELDAKDMMGLHYKISHARTYRREHQIA